MWRLGRESRRSRRTRLERCRMLSLLEGDVVQDVLERINLSMPTCVCNEHMLPHFLEYDTVISPSLFEAQPYTRINRSIANDRKSVGRQMKSNHVVKSAFIIISHRWTLPGICTAGIDNCNLPTPSTSITISGYQIIPQRHAMHREHIRADIPTFTQYTIFTRGPSRSSREQKPTILTSARDSSA